jgi:hypothetical protein
MFFFNLAETPPVKSAVFILARSQYSSAPLTDNREAKMVRPSRIRIGSKGNQIPAESWHSPLKVTTSSRG